MRWNNIDDYGGDFALVEFVPKRTPDECSIVGCAVRFKGVWKEPFTGKEYIDNKGNPLIPIGWVDLDELADYLTDN